MANVLVNDASLTAIGNSIRGKNGTQNTYTPAEMASAIDAIETGGEQKFYLPPVYGDNSTRINKQKIDINTVLFDFSSKLDPYNLDWAFWFAYAGQYDNNTKYYRLITPLATKFTGEEKDFVRLEGYGIYKFTEPVTEKNDDRPFATLPFERYIHILYNPATTQLKILSDLTGYQDFNEHCMSYGNLLCRKYK